MVMNVRGCCGCLISFWIFASFCTLMSALAPSSQNSLQNSLVITCDRRPMGPGDTCTHYTNGVKTYSTDYETERTKSEAEQKNLIDNRQTYLLASSISLALGLIVAWFFAIRNMVASIISFVKNLLAKKPKTNVKSRSTAP